MKILPLIILIGLCAGCNKDPLKLKAEADPVREAKIEAIKKQINEGSGRSSHPETVIPQAEARMGGNMLSGADEVTVRIVIVQNHAFAVAVSRTGAVGICEVTHGSIE